MIGWPTMVGASGGTLVLMDYAAENIATDYLAVDGGRGRGAGEWLVEMETAMGPGFVVVAEVLGEQRLEMSSRHDEEVIEALLADGPHEPLGKSIRPRRGDRGSQGLNPDGGENGVEARGELGVAIEEAEVTPGVLEVRRKVAGHLGHPGTVGVGGDTEQVHSSSVDLNHDEHVEAAQRDRVDGEEAGSQDAFGLGTQELTPGGARAPRRGR